MFIKLLIKEQSHCHIDPNMDIKQQDAVVAGAAVVAGGAAVVVD